jgi:hypothetical protein
MIDPILQALDEAERALAKIASLKSSRFAAERARVVAADALAAVERYRKLAGRRPSAPPTTANSEMPAHAHHSTIEQPPATSDLSLRAHEGGEEWK